MEIIKNKFRDKIFGDEFEYIVIKNKEEKQKVHNKLKKRFL